MLKDKSRALYGDPLIPDTLHADECGPSSSEAAFLLNLVDLDHPASATVIAVLREMRESGAEMDEAAVRIAVSVGRQRWEHREQYAPPSTGKLPCAPNSIVYYVRRGGLIKIGTTRRPERRFLELMPDEILAVEPGTYQQERRRHRQFAHLRCAGEYFSAAPELVDHAARLRALHGAPDPSWVTAAPAPRPSPPAGSPAPAVPAQTRGDMLLTRAEAAEVAGVSVERIRTWERRGHLECAGLNEAGQRVYEAVEVAKVLHKLDGFTRVSAAA
jgi:hypothetical protein